MKIWLTIMAGPGSLADLQELWSPIKPYFAGICATYFGDRDDQEAKYLESEKGEGHITYLPYTGRHDLARICAVHCGKIENGDVVCQFDTLERLSTQFAAAIQELMGNMDQIDAFYYYGKIFLYRYHESITFQGTPHEGWLRRDKQPICLELSKAYPNESDVRLNVRPLKRPKDHSFNHFLRYYLTQPWGSNTCLLGLDANGDINTLFPIVERRRLAFREEMTKRGYSLSVQGFKKMIDDGVPEDMRHFFDEEKVLSDAYHHHFGRTDIKCSHLFSDRVPIEWPAISS